LVLLWDLGYSLKTSDVTIMPLCKEVNSGCGEATSGSGTSMTEGGAASWYGTEP
jgi:hypothetical protein